MRALLIATMAIASLSCMAQNKQDSWKVTLNSKVLLNTSTEDPTKNVVKIKSSDLKKSGYLEVKYKDAEPNTWIRSFTLNDEKDAELLRKDSSSTFRLPVSAL